MNDPKSRVGSGAGLEQLDLLKADPGNLQMLKQAHVPTDNFSHLRSSLHKTATITPPLFGRECFFVLKRGFSQYVLKVRNEMLLAAITQDIG